MSEWDDEKRKQVVAMYLERGPTPENSMDLVKEIAEEIGASPNGVRMILSKEEVYIKKANGGAADKKTNGGTGVKKIGKEEAHARLTHAIEAKGGSADTDIVSKMTGKAALYFAEILENRNND